MRTVCPPVLRSIMLELSTLSPRMSGILGGAAIERLREVTYAEAIQIYSLLRGEGRVVELTGLHIYLPSLSTAPPERQWPPTL